MKKLEDYVVSIPDYPEPRNHFQRCDQHSAGCRGIAAGY